MDLKNVRRRAAQQSQYGDYWAGKCVALIDLLEKERAHWDELCDKQLDAEGMLRFRIAELQAELEKAKQERDHFENAFVVTSEESREIVAELKAELAATNGGIDPRYGQHAKLDLFRVDL